MRPPRVEFNETHLLNSTAEEEPQTDDDDELEIYSAGRLLRYYAYKSSLFHSEVESDDSSRSL